MPAVAPAPLPIAERREQALRLRRKGMSLRAIASALGVSVFTAHRDIAVSGLTAERPQHPDERRERE